MRLTLKTKKRKKCGIATSQIIGCPKSYKEGLVMILCYEKR